MTLRSKWFLNIKFYDRWSYSEICSKMSLYLNCTQWYISPLLCAIVKWYMYIYHGESRFFSIWRECCILCMIRSSPNGVFLYEKGGNIFWTINLKEKKQSQILMFIIYALCFKKIIQVNTTCISLSVNCKRQLSYREQTTQVIYWPSL